MATIYLFHPKHGVKIATMEMEAQYDEMNGWSRFDPDEYLPGGTVEDVPMIEDLAPGEANEMAAPRRRGRPRANPDG